MQFNKFYSIILLSAASTILYSCGGADKEKAAAAAAAAANAPKQVNTYTVEAASGVTYDEYPATVAALNLVQLTPQVTGYITGIYFQDGQYVHKGQKLYSIDPQVYDANAQNAVANLAVQEANLVKAQKDAVRYHQLDKQDAIAKQQVDYADAALMAAQKQVAAARATIKSQNASVQFTTIYAPFDGTIGISNVRKGQLVVSGTTVLNTVSSDNPMAVDIPINQSELYSFLKFEKSAGSASDSVFTLKFGSDIYPFPGQIYILDRAVDPQTGTIKVRLKFPNGQNLLKAGMNGIVRVKFFNNASGTAVQIPSKAITEQLGTQFVYVVQAENKVTQRIVTLGATNGSMVTVNTGLKAGDVIVVEGQQNLAEGVKVATGGAAGAPKAAK